MEAKEAKETIPDIVAEMRKMKRYAKSDSNDCRYVAYWCYQTFADRIEAAWKRERDRNCDLYATVSDARKAFNEWLKHNRPISFGGWLLMPSEERKGEGDGR